MYVFHLHVFNFNPWPNQPSNPSSSTLTLTRQPQPRPQMMTPPPGEPFWIEHKSPDGKAYYSNPITHETTWQRPANVLVQPGPPFVAPTSQPSSPSTPPQLPFPQSSGGALLVPTKVWSEHKNSEGKMYYYNKITLQSVWEKPKDFDLILPMPVTMASSGPANDASTSTPAAATTSSGSEGDTQKDDGGQQQDNGDATQQTSSSATIDQAVPGVPPPSDGDMPTEPQKEETTASDAKVLENMETESAAPATTVSKLVF